MENDIYKSEYQRVLADVKGKNTMHFLEAYMITFLEKY